VKLQPEAEEIMTFYAKMLDHDYVTKKDFNKNFFVDWRKVRFCCLIIFINRITLP